MLVEKEEAMKVLKEVAPKFEQNMQNIKLAPPILNDNLSIGYKIQVNNSPSISSIREIQQIIEKYGLSIKEENGNLIIYKPHTEYFNRV